MLRSIGEATYFSGAFRGVAGSWLGVGAILMFHRVRPASMCGFEPNRMLDVSPQFLEAVIRRLRDLDVDFVSIDEAYRRLTECDFRRQFVSFTFDDGYRDNRAWAYPVLQRYAVPFTIYVTTKFADGIGDLWWVVLEQVIARADEIRLKSEPGNGSLRCVTVAEKHEAFRALYRSLRTMPSEQEMLDAIHELATDSGVDTTTICRDLCMSWKELAELAADPLVTIGAHTVSHSVLGRASEQVVRSELDDCRTRMMTWLGQRPCHLAYPFGDATAVGVREYAIAAELGFRTAVTASRGVLHREDGVRLTALPRVSVSDECQRSFGVDVLVSGPLMAMLKAMRTRLFA